MTEPIGPARRDSDARRPPPRAESAGQAAPAGPRPLNILMVTAWSPEHDVGGVSTVIRTLAAELSRRHSVQVLVNDWRARQLIETQEVGVRCHRLWLRTPYVPGKVLIGLAAWIIWSPRILLQLRRFLQREAIDVVHLHFSSAYQFYFRILRMLGGPAYVVTLHGSDTANLAHWPGIDRFLTRWTVDGAARVIAVSASLEKRARDVFPGARDIQCLRNGVDLAEIARFQAAAAESSPPVELPASFCVLVGNVTRSKGPDIAIRAWSELKARLPDLHLVIVGEPRESWEPCRQLIAELGCGERVHMAGALARDDAIRLMRRATALVAPSRNEGLSVVILEAGAVGLAVACSRIEPFLEIVEDGRSALVVAPDDPGALAEAVVRLVGDAQLRRRLGQALRQVVEQRFPARRMAQDYEAVYRAVLA